MIAVGIAIQSYVAGRGNQYTHYNNYVIFKQSYEHLIHNSNLYKLYPDEHFDFYKYSPAFALFMAPFYYLPDFIGLMLFNLLNAGLLIAALLRLRLPSQSYKFIFLFILLELAISLSMTQTNALMAGLIILGFTFMEEDKPFPASLMITLSVFIKLFGMVAFILWLFYPSKSRFIIYSIFWFTVLTILPILVNSPPDLLQQYQNWFTLLKNDHDASYGISFMGWMHSWFNLDLPKTGTVAVAALVFCLPLLKFKLYKLYFFRLQVLASILLWIVIFNHKGENPTYIIAMSGIAIWYFSQKTTSGNKILLWLAVIFTSFSSTDLITPGWIAERYVEPYAVKAVTCCVIWFKLLFDLMSENFTNAVLQEKVSKEQVGMLS
ncbi:MAG: hypothetical protein JWQ40_693 [Segetibacter sp.]|nr:hypothetical protein [Segetibacter sp.]